MATKSDTYTAQQKGRPEGGAAFETSTSARHVLDWVFAVLVFTATMIGLVVLAVLLVDVARDGKVTADWAD